MRPLEKLFARFARGSANRLDGLDLEWLDDGFEWHGSPPLGASLSPYGEPEKPGV